MAWIVDPSFGNTISYVDAFAPFSVGGGNKVLSVNGGGAVYNNAVSLLNIDISCDLVVRRYAGTGSFPSLPSSMHLIGRRQANGSFYSASFVTANFFAYKGIISLYYYNGVSDTFTTIGGTRIDTTYSELPISTSEIITFNFRIFGNSISARILRNNSFILESGAINSSIAIAGNPGIGGTLFLTAPSDGEIGSSIYIDNFVVREAL